MINFLIPTLFTAPIDPTMVFCQKLAGHWYRKGPNAEMNLTFKIDDDGKSLSGESVVTAGKNVFRMHSRFGWDAAAKKVYYLDAHAEDTVYFGHCWLVGDEFRNDFTAIVGGTGHWIQHAKFTDPNTFDSELYTVGKDGKETLIEHFVFKRVK